MDEPAPRPDVFRAVKGALAQGATGVRDMPQSLLRHVPYALLYGERTGRSDGAVVKAYLDRFGEAGRSAPRRLWTHYVISLEADDLATNEIAGWLKRNRDVLPERLRDFSSKYEVLDPARSPIRMATEALGGDGFAEDVGKIGFSLQRLRPSALMAAILEGVGSALRGGSLMARDPIGRVKALLEGHVENAIAATQAREEVRRRALATFIEGFVSWQRRVDRYDQNPGPVLDLLTSVNEDPRFSPEKWRGIVTDATIDIIEGWLTRHTIEAFFRVVNRLPIERQDMWDDRREFWMAYLEFVHRAWLIVGERGVPFAQQEKIRFGRFRGGAFADHCGLVLDFGDLCALEMNMNGRAVLWRPAEVHPSLLGKFPKVYDETPYDRGTITRYATGMWSQGCVGIVHNGPWQRKIADVIQQRTNQGIRPRGV
ncbi:EH signature domain-containing protein [Paracraurococcus lichenis]|uniref:EH signature domain-containing protein n=1 Tax=Paracraurococcus lichenis TaxID=3064888 RepID=A0ABT9EAH9_9PROT|nr:EH signature domain-containing protein [Paracraurococcus sp. LOR1-02]MDO9713176.1 EH signature domain-containing protein [Paracraurococcus sp. LOR1-02]